MKNHYQVVMSASLPQIVHELEKARDNHIYNKSFINKLGAKLELKMMNIVQHSYSIPRDQVIQYANGQEILKSLYKYN